MKAMLSVYTVGAIAVAFIYHKLSNIEPYMDEIFHIPQAKAYCEGNFGLWDPKITTFPGLYILSATIPLLLKYIFPLYDICVDAYFRAINVVLGAVFPFVLGKCRDKIFDDYSEEGSVWIQLMIAVYPMHFFYNFLFYTDTLSTVCLVAVYAIANYTLLERRSMAGDILVLLATTLCILARQTNAVWIMFVAGTLMLRLLERQGLMRNCVESPWSTLTCFCKALILNLPHVLTRTWPLLLPVGIFAAFVVHNGGIVVGDKDNHQMVLHPAMPLHLMVAICIMMGPAEVLNTAWDLLARVNRCDTTAGVCGKNEKTTHFSLYIRWSVFSMLTGLCACILWFGVKSHPFLLADNRHLTFYIWKYILSNTARRVCLSPLYAMCIMVVFSKLSQTRGVVWIVIYIIAVLLTLVPAHLFELRYFTPAAVIAVLNMPQVSAKTGLVSICCSSVINAFLLGIYCQPFTWVDGSTARFML